ncbi:MAG: helix-turn-helix domain-containing protein [Oscillospiraceae bacterium]|nr:helix-turn-helix domain-containing protein [Oscillospiraceae bacterium]
MLRIIIPKNRQVPVWEKANLSLEEAADYFGIGINKLREMTNDTDCKFVLWNGSKRMIKRRVLEKYLEESFSI